MYQSREAYAAQSSTAAFVVNTDSVHTHDPVAYLVIIHCECDIAPVKIDVKIHVDAWNANDDVIAPHKLGSVALISFDLYYFCSFEYSLLVHLITNCTLKSISAQSKRFTNCFLLLDCMFIYSVQAWCAPLCCGELAPHSDLEYVLQRFYSSFFTMSSSLQRYSWNASKENGGEKIVSPVWTGP